MQVVLGLMSGTSLDGVDAALLQTDGWEIGGFGRTAYRAYSPAEQRVLRAALGQWDGAAVQRAAALIEEVHAEVISGFPEAELVGFHGQTLAHDPTGRGTLQVGDGARLAQMTGKTVVWDFRSADIQLGGQGAPLAPFYHHALARKIGAQRPLAFLNLGGIGNITFADPRIEFPEKPGACLAFDTGPANAPIDDFMRKRRSEPCDRDGALAATGQPDADMVEAFRASPYLGKPPPKSLDRQVFVSLLDQVKDLSDADGAATLTAIAAAGVGRAMDYAPAWVERICVTGGGRHNKCLMKMIAQETRLNVVPVEHLGFDGDMLEAQAFGYLAVRVQNGMPTSCPSTTGVMAMVGGGQISRPD